MTSMQPWRLAAALRALLVCLATLCASASPALAQTGSLGGTVKDAVSLTGINAVTVNIYTSAGTLTQQALTAADGTYLATGLPVGTYYVRTQVSGNMNYMDELYNELPCTFSCIPITGAPVTVTSGGSTSGVNFTLAQGGSVSGTVTDAVTHLGIPNQTVRVYQSNGTVARSSVSSSDGTYTIGGLPTGTYYARTVVSTNYLDELYNNIPCWSTCTVTTGAPIAVTTGATASGVNFDLVPGSTVSGTVSDSGSAAPIASVNVFLYNSSNISVRVSSTDAGGTYSIDRLPAGTYYLRASPASGSNYVAQLYSGIICPSACLPTTGTPVVVGSGATTSGINFPLTIGGTLTGTVRRADTMAALANISVSIYSQTGPALFTTLTNGSGVFSTSGLPPGTYYARTIVTGAQNYVDGLYNGLPCFPSCTVTTGSPISVTAGATTGSIDFALAPGGAISGRVTNAVTLTNVAAITVAVYYADGTFRTSVSTPADGTYTLSGLATGTYYVKTLGSTFINELYDNIVCPNCSPTSGTPIAVTAGATTSNIDFAVNPGGTITGTVTDASNGAPLSGIPVWVLSSPPGTYSGSANTNISGQFFVSGLPAGNYVAFTSVSTNQNYLNEAYNNIPCPGVCSSETGTVIAVTAGNATSNVNFALTPGATVSGTVTSSSGTPLSNVTVTVYSSAGASLNSATTNASGAYSVSRLPAGSLLVRTRVPAGQNYVDEVYSDIPCVGCSVTIGTPVSATAGGTTSGINFALSGGGSITGIVTDASTGNPVSGFPVSIYSAAGLYLTSAFTIGGAYTAVGLPTGTYYARTSAADLLNLVDQVYAGVSCLGACLVTSGTPIQVAADAVTSGVDFALAPGGSITGTVTDAGTSLPVNGSQVEVEVRLYSSSEVFLDYTNINSSGLYSFPGLPTGSYLVRTANSGGYIDEVFDNITARCVSTCDISDGTPVAVTTGVATTGIDFALAAGGRIGGRVTDATSGAPIPNVTVKVFSSDGAWASFGATDAAGDYLTHQGLPASSYYVRTFDETGHIDEHYNNQPICAPSCLPTAGTPVAVVVPSTTAGVDFALARGTELIQNGSFTNGTANWLLFATPTASYMTWDAPVGTFRFNRQPPPPGTSNQAVIFQNTNTALPANTPLVARFVLSNTSVVRKRISVLIHDSNFSDLAVCTFWLPPNTEDMPYTMRTRTTAAWSNATISFYAASTNVPAGFYAITNVSLQAQPSAVVERTDCLDPFVAPAPGGADGSNLLVNGDFASGAVSPGWSMFGQIQGQVSNGVFEFIKVAGAPAGVLLQPTGQAIPANTLLSATFELGNSSSVRKRVTVIVHDNNFSDLSACTFWVPPGQSLLPYTVRMFTTQAWSNATLSVYPATVGADQWIRFDNATLRKTPGTVVFGAECLEPLPPGRDAGAATGAAPAPRTLSRF